MPFAGRAAIRYLVLTTRDSRTKGARARNFSALAVTVGAMTVGHGIRLTMGVTDLMQHAQLFMAHPSLLAGLFLAVDAAYSAANGAAIYTQADIVCRTGRHAWDNRDGTVETMGPPKERSAPRITTMVGDIAFSAAGLMAFMAVDGQGVGHGI